MTDKTAPTGGLAPVITAATITAGATAIIALLVAFGVPLTDEQQTAILGVIAVAGPLIVGFVGRHTTVEYAAGGVVVRGAANEGVTGQIVRPLGALGQDPEPRRAAEDDAA